MPKSVVSLIAISLLTLSLHAQSSVFPPVSGVVSPSTNGGAYWDGTKLTTTATGGAGTLCYISANGGTPAWGGCSGSASTVWSSLSNPAGSLSLSMAANPTTFTWNTATGAINGLKLIDGTSNTGTGILLWSTTASGSAMIPWQADSNGNGLKISPSGVVTLVGSGVYGSLLFTDNTVDIGASGANRPRNLFVAGNGTFGGTFQVTGHVTLEGVTSAGATGSSNLVFSGSPTIVTPTIASFVNATHNHQNAAGGGTLDTSAIGSGTLGVARGGWGLGTLTAHSLYVGNGTSAPNAVAVGGTDKPLVGVTGADPVFSKVTLTNPATGATLTLQDGTTLTGPAASGTAATLGNTETFSGDKTFTGKLDASGGTHTLPMKVGLAASKPATCTAGELYFATDATAGQQIYECSSTNTWTQQLNSGGGSGSVVLTSGSGAPVASCTAPSSSNLAIYTDTTNNQAYYCSATNTWRRLLSVNPTDPLGIAGTTQSQASAITQNGGSVPASSILCYADSTANTLICLDSSSNAFSMVKADTGASHNFLTAISANGIISKAQPAFTDISGSVSTGQLPAIPLSSLATQAADTIVMNATGGSAAPTAVAAPSGGTNGCAGTTDTPTYNTTTHAWGCHQITGGGGGGTLLTPPNQTFTSQTSPQTFTHNLNTTVHQTLCSDGSGNEAIFGVTLGANSDTITFTGTQTFTCTAIGGLASYTIATLPASPTTNTPALVTDATATGNCTTGGGTAKAFCVYNGTSWVSVAGSGGSGTVTSSGPPSAHQVAVFTSSTDVKGVGVGTTDKPLVGVTSGDPAFSKLTLTNPATGATFTLADGKTLTVNNSLTFAGTDSTTITTPTTSATMARTDAGQTFTGVQTFSTAIATTSGGTGTGSALTGLVRGGSPFTAAELSGDCATSGSNAVTCSQVNGSNFTVNSSGVPTKVGGVTTAGVGVPSVISAADVTAQSASQGSVTVATSPAAGVYLLKYAAYQDGTGGNCTVSFTFNWTDSSARSLTTGNLGLTTAQATGNYLSGEFPLYVGSGNVTYTSTVSGSCGGSTYAMRPRLIKD